MPPDRIPVVCVGLSYRNATVELLERVSVPTEALAEALRELSDTQGEEHRELVVLSTCNRVEIYGIRPELVSTASAYLARRSGLPSAAIERTLTVYSGQEAARHLFRVACGLDSLVMGESQILGQVESAYAAAQGFGCAGSIMTALFQTAIRCGKRARNETGIGRSAENISSAAVRLAESYVGDLAAARVLVVGSGEMGRLAVRTLHTRGAERIDLVNRHYEHAAKVARRWGAKAHLFQNLPCLLATSDVVVSSTSAPHPIISAEMVRRAIEERQGRPLVLIDIAVPRDIDPESASIPGVHLFDVDALKSLETAEEGPTTAEVPAVEGIIGEELAAAQVKMAEIALRPVIAELWQRAGAIRSEVLAHTRSRLPGLDEEGWAQVEGLAQALVNKLLHAPATRLRSEAANGHASDYAEALRYLFDLHAPESSGAPAGDKAEGR